VSLVNTVLNTITAEEVAESAGRIEKSEDAATIARYALKKHWKVIFSGNNYDHVNQEMLTNRGVWRIGEGVEAITLLTAEKHGRPYRARAPSPPNGPP
jgi:glutamine synthetase